MLTESVAPGRAQSASTYKMLNAVSKNEEYYADPIFRVLWLVASTLGVSLPRPCAKRVPFAPLVSSPFTCARRAVCPLTRHACRRWCRRHNKVLGHACIAHGLTDALGCVQ